MTTDNATPNEAGFDSSDIQTIMNAKDNLKVALRNFEMTIQKLGRNMKDGYFVTGGCIGSLIRGETPNDYDIYFKDIIYADPVVRLYTQDDSYKNEVADVNDKYADAKNFGVDGKVITSNAITLKNGLQLITKIYGDPKTVCDTFDFVHCRPYYDPAEDKLYISHEQYMLNVKRILKTNNASNVKEYRIQKFMNRGWGWP